MDGASSSDSSVASMPCLVTAFNDLGGGRFSDPRNRRSFRYDHLRKEASDPQPWNPPVSVGYFGQTFEKDFHIYSGVIRVPHQDGPLESLRAAIEAEATAYALNHYKHGAVAAFAVPNAADGPAVVVCIEDHQFQPKNYW